MASSFFEHPDLEFLIIAALVNGGRNWNRLMPFARSYARAVISRHAPKLGEDKREEVFQRALERLIAGKGRAIDPAKGSAKTYFYGLVRTAIQHVRAINAPPGSVTRKRGREKLAMEIVSFDEVGANKATAAGSAAASELEDRLDAAKILKFAPPLVRAGLEEMFYEDRTQGDAAELLGISRHKLGRDMRRYTAHVLAAA
jgi:DNA-directed RNA polymerase specialized sigma24 family protein